MSGYRKIGGYRARQIMDMAKYGPVPLRRIMMVTGMPKHTMWNALLRMEQEKLVKVDNGMVTRVGETGSRWHQWDMSRPIIHCI